MSKPSEVSGDWLLNTAGKIPGRWWLRERVHFLCGILDELGIKHPTWDEYWEGRKKHESNYATSSS